MTERRCHGEGWFPVNPGYPDPQTEYDVRCPGCPDCDPDPLPLDTKEGGE